MTTDRPYIAIAIDDAGQLWDDHFGEAPYFAIYDRGGILIETRSNPYSPTHGTEQKKHGDPQQIIDLLPECGVFIAASMGLPQVVQSRGIEAVLTTEETPLAALQAYQAGQE